MAEGGVLDPPDRFTCTICLEHFKKPKLLPCFHTFCLACLETFVVKNSRGDRFGCPLCRSTIEVPSNGVDGFQTNFYIEAAEGSADPGVIFCDFCETKTPADHRCSDCKENMCQSCSRGHLKSKASRHHKVYELVSVESAVKQKIVSKVFCSIHFQEEVKLFCKQCDTILCIVCKMTSHENHPTNDIASEGLKIRKSIHSCLSREEVGKSDQQIKKSIAEEEEVDKELAISFERSLKDIKDNAELLHSVVDDVVKEKEKETKMNYKILKTEVRTKLEKLEREYRSSIAFKDAVQLVLDHDTDVELLKNTKNLQAKLEQLTLRKQTVERTNVPQTLFEHSSGSCLRSMLETFVHRVPTTYRNRKFLNTERLKLVSIMKSNIGWVRGIALIGNGKAWLSEFNESRVQLVSVNDGAVTTINIGLTADYTTVNKRGEAIISCPDAKSVLRITSDCKVETIVSNLEMHPHGIASYQTADGKERLLIACTDSNGYLATHGIIVEVDQGSTKTTTSIVTGCDGSHRIAVEPETGAICTADYRTCLVRIYDRNGKVRAIYSDSDFRPADVKFYGSDRILAGNYGKDVRVIKTDGSLDKILLKDECYSLAVDDDDNLWVGTKSHVKVYKIE